jgi:hypothetical protein
LDTQDAIQLIRQSKLVGLYHACDRMMREGMQKLTAQEKELVWPVIELDKERQDGARDKRTSTVADGERPDRQCAEGRHK